MSRKILPGGGDGSGERCGGLNGEDEETSLQLSNFLKEVMGEHICLEHEGRRLEGSLSREKGMSSGEGRVSDKTIGQLCCRAHGVLGNGVSP